MISNDKRVAPILSPALKFDGWLGETIGYLFNATVSFVHHFKAIGEFNLGYSPETLNSGQNRRMFLSRVTLTFHVGPLKTIGHIFYVALSFVYYFIAISES